MFVFVHIFLGFFMFQVTAIQALAQARVVHVGSSVTFSCSVEDTMWLFFSASYSSQSLTVYEYPDITPTFMSRYSVSRHNLSINNVQLCDAGNYRCSFASGDDLGADNFELIVVDFVSCDSEKGNEHHVQSAQNCHVNHSINTVPTCSCPLQSGPLTMENVESEMKQLHVSQCAYDSIVYNETTFTINITDIVNPMACIVRYSAVGNTSGIYAEEQFDVLHDVMSTPVTLDSAKKTTENNHGAAVTALMLAVVVSCMALVTTATVALVIVCVCSKRNQFDRIVTDEPDMRRHVLPANPDVAGHSADDEAGSNTESTGLCADEASLHHSLPTVLVQAATDKPLLQQQQPPEGDDDDDDDDDDVPQYAELAPSIRRTQQRVRIVDNSTAVYASIVHPPRNAQP